MKTTVKVMLLKPLDTENVYFLKYKQLVKKGKTSRSRGRGVEGHNEGTRVMTEAIFILARIWLPFPI